MSSRQLVVLGTGSQAPTKQRNHNGYALKFDNQLIVFDPGEGFQRQCAHAGLAIARATAVCLTHFHGDHCLGIPGIIQRRMLDRIEQPLRYFFPEEGSVYFERLRTCSAYHDLGTTAPEPLPQSGSEKKIGHLKLTSRKLNHRIPVLGYRVEESDRVGLNKEKLESLELHGPAVGQLLSQGQLEHHGQTVTLDQISETRRGQSMAFVMDTRPCAEAAELASGVDVLVCEATYIEADANLADTHFHMTAGQAGKLAAEAGVNLLVLTHFSQRYQTSDRLLAEARAEHPNVVAASDLTTIAFPARK